MCATSIWHRAAAIGIAFISATIFCLAACGGKMASEDYAGAVKAEFLAPRADYDTELPWEQMVKPFFFSYTEDGEESREFGSPEEVVVREGRVKIRAVSEEKELYIDPLALASEHLGEHPVHKVYRLKAKGVALSPELEGVMESGKGIDGLFHGIEFEYMQGRTARGTVAEVFPDGTFLVIPFDELEPWQSTVPEVASPTHFHVSPRALTAATSDLAQQYEKRILGLSFDRQRYPPADVAAQQCGVYSEAVTDPKYLGLLEEVGYRLEALRERERLTSGNASLGEVVPSLLREAAGPGVSYSGYEGQWVAGLLRDLGADWLEDCDTAGGPRPLADAGGSGGYYLQVRKSLQEDKRDRYKVARLEGDGPPIVIYNAPGIMLMALPLPGQGSRWLMSAEGWPAAGAGIPADPRWQSVYLVDLNSPDTYEKVEFPIGEFPRAPESGLYGSSAAVTANGQYLVNTLYGFADEGGGLWIADLSQEDFHRRPEAFRRIVDWDHALNWTLLDPEVLEHSGVHTLFLTGKEVADNFAMTANLLQVEFDGLDFEVRSRQRLLQMVGWNPVPFAVQKLGDGKFRVAAETYLDYESSLLPRAKGVYILPVDLEQTQ